MDKFREIGGQEGLVGLGLDITPNCQFNCPFCYWKDGVYPFFGNGQRLSFEDFLRITSWAKQVGFTELYFVGKEPTLHPELPGMIEEIRGEFHTILVTNGLLFENEDFCEELGKTGISLAMRRHFIGNRQGYSEVIGTSEFDYSHIIDLAWGNVETFWKGKICVQCNVLSPLIGASIPRVFKWSRANSFHPVIEIVKSGAGFPRGNPLDVSLDETYKLFCDLQVLDRGFWPDKAPDCIVPPVYGEPCTMCETGMHMLLDGRVIPCTGLPTVTYGNILAGEGEKILNSPARQMFSELPKWIAGPCRDCEFFRVCHGGCQGETFIHTGCPRASDPWCWHQPKSATLKDMVPKTCKDCPLEEHSGCKIKV